MVLIKVSALMIKFKTCSALRIINRTPVGTAIVKTHFYKRGKTYAIKR
jgi:hypothetical protein